MANGGATNASDAYQAKPGREATAHAPTCRWYEQAEDGTESCDCGSAGRETTCVQATDRPEWCCFDRTHGAAMVLLMLGYGEDRMVMHTVCGECADEAEAGRLPEQHSDAEVLRVYR